MAEPEDPTGLKEAQEAAAISFMPNSSVPPGYRQIPVPSPLPDLDNLDGTMCVVQVVKDPVPPAGEVLCQSVCQRVATPDVVDLRVLLVGDGTFTWDGVNSGFSLDGGVNWYALDPDTMAEGADPINGVVVDRERQFNFVLDLADHIDSWNQYYGGFIGDPDPIDFRVSFTVT